MGTDDDDRTAVEVDYHEAIELAERLTSTIAAVRGRASSTDGSVTATVGPHGVLLDLDIRLDPGSGADEVPTGAQLSRRVLEATSRAGQLAHHQRLAAIEACLPAGLRRLVGPDGEVDPMALLPSGGPVSGRGPR